MVNIWNRLPSLSFSCSSTKRTHFATIRSGRGHSQANRTAVAKWVYGTAETFTGIWGSDSQGLSARHTARLRRSPRARRLHWPN